MLDDAYAIPSVASIKAQSLTSGYVAASTFAGAGGSSTGYRWAGFDVRWVSEYEQHAGDSYALNWPDTILDRRDVRDVTADAILNACRVDVGELDLFDGSPPCQPFSTAGRREANWGRTVEHSDGSVNRGGSEDLVDEWVRLVDDLQPRVAVMENVAGMARGVAKGYLNRTLSATAAAGYRVGARLVDAKWLGTPQQRKRVILVAVRNDLDMPPVHPKPYPRSWSTLDACPWLDGSEWVEQLRSKQFGANGKQRWIPLTETHGTILASGSGGTSGQLRRRDGSTRLFTTRELRRICGFPDDYQFAGSSATKAWARMGNSVPPPLAHAVGSALIDLLRRADES